MKAGSTVLLVDDSEDDSMFFQRAAKKHHIQLRIHWARNGQEAMDYVLGTDPYADRELYPFPSFIITDSRMPFVSGTEFLQWLSEHPEYSIVPKIVFSTGVGPNEVTHAYQNLGVHSFIEKPFEPQELERVVKLIFDYWAICRVPSVPELSSRS